MLFGLDLSPDPTPGSILGLHRWESRVRVEVKVKVKAKVGDFELMKSI